MWNHFRPNRTPPSVVNTAMEKKGPPVPSSNESCQVVLPSLDKTIGCYLKICMVWDRIISSRVPQASKKCNM